MSDEKYVGAVAAAKQAALIKAYVNSKMKKDFVVNITFDSTSAPAAIDDSKTAVFNASTDKTFAEISSAVAAGKNVYGMWNGHKWPLYLSSSTSYAFRGHIQLTNLFGTVGLAIAICSIWQDGCDVTVSAGELPVPALDGTDDGKGIVVSGNKWTMKKAVVDDAMSATSTNPVQNKVVKAELDKKAGKGIATAEADGLMSAADKVKLDGVEDGATKTIVDDAMSDTSTNPVQNKVVMKYIDSRGSLPPVSVKNDTMLIQVVDGAYALRTKESIFPVDDALDTESKNAVENGVIARRFEQLSGAMLPATSKRDGLMTAANYTKLSGIETGANKTVVDATLDAASTNPVQNKAVKAALDGKAGTAVATTSANGLMSAADKTKLDGVEAGANKTTVDAALDAASENPVQNKAVKAALDGKLSTLGGEISGHLSVGLTVSAEGAVSTGRTSTDTGIHFEKAASDAGRISHGSDPMTGVAPIARLKVASPTEDDDAATKEYVDGSAVRYDAAQTLTDAQKLQARRNINAAGVDSPQFQGYVTLTPANGTLGAGVGLSPTRDGNNYALNISDVNEGWPTLLTGVKTPTDADTNAAATVEYVKAKAASGGGITPTIGDNGNWYLGTTDTGKPSRGEKGDKGEPGAAGAPGKDGAGMDITGATAGQIAKITAVDASGVPTAWSPADMPSGGSSDAVLYTTQTLTDAQKRQARDNIGALRSEEPIIKGGAFTLETPEAQIRAQLDGYLTSETGEDFANIAFSSTHPDATNDKIVISGLANFGDAEAVGLEDTAVSYAQLVEYTTPLVLTYANGQATGASYTDIRKAIERGRQIKLSVANTPDIIASNARNETNKSVLKFIHTDVGGDTVNIAQYTVTAQASGLTAHVKSYEIAQ